MYTLWGLRFSPFYISFLLIPLFTAAFVTKAMAVHHIVDIPLGMSARTSTAEYTYQAQLQALRRAVTVPLLDPRIAHLPSRSIRQALHQLRMTRPGHGISRITLRGLDANGHPSADPPVDLLVRDQDLYVIGFINGEQGRRHFYRFEEPPLRDEAGQRIWDSTHHDYMRPRRNPAYEPVIASLIHGLRQTNLRVSYDYPDLAYWSGFSHDPTRPIEYRPNDPQRRDGRRHYRTLTISRATLASSFRELSHFTMQSNAIHRIRHNAGVSNRETYRAQVSAMARAFQRIVIAYMEGLRFRTIEESIAAGSLHRSPVPGPVAVPRLSFDAGGAWNPETEWPLIRQIIQWGEISFMGSQGINASLNDVSPATLRLNQSRTYGRQSGHSYVITSAPESMGQQVSWARVLAVILSSQWQHGRQEGVVLSCSAPSLSQNYTTTSRHKRGLPRQTDPCANVSWMVTSPIGLFGGIYLPKKEITRLVADFMTDSNDTLSRIRALWHEYSVALGEEKNG